MPVAIAKLFIFIAKISFFRIVNFLLLQSCYKSMKPRLMLTAGRLITFQPPVTAQMRLFAYFDAY